MSGPEPGVLATDESRPHPLHPFFAPRSVVLIGASERPGSVGRAVAANLLDFPGEVHFVNPHRAAILGRPAIPTLDRLPGPVDLAVIATPAAGVPGVVRECAAAGIHAAVILSAGFRECGAEGAALEAEVRAAAQAGGVRLIGPNCLGLMIPGSGLNASFAAGPARPGHLAFLSQSGALCTAILDWSQRENVGFSAFVSVGAMADVGWGDLIDYFGDDPGTRAIVLYMESVGDARAFLSAAREVALAKPVVLIKVGRTDEAARAAASHTGAMTGSDAVLDAAFARAGVLRVDTLSELFDLAELLAKQPPPPGPGLAIVTNAGGPGALATDELVRAGGRLAVPGADTLEALDAFLPPPWSHGNPVDLLGDADAARYGRALEIVMADPGVDGALVILTPQAMTDVTGTAQAVIRAAGSVSKPVLTSWMGGNGVAPGRDLLNAAGIPTFDQPDVAARAFSLMWRHRDALRDLYETPVDCIPAGDVDSAGVAAAAVLVDQARRAGRTLLTEPESKELLAAYGIPVVPTRVAFTAEEAVAHARELGFPVVLKLFSETITHKSDVGGVVLDVATPEGVREAWGRIHGAVGRSAGARHFLGVTVQPMVPAGGVELIVGASCDPQFGPVLLFGAGGTQVEVFGDRALALPPVTDVVARRWIAETRISQVLRGHRGRPAADLGQLTSILMRFGRLVTDHPRIAEIDVNPLRSVPGGFVALDVRVVLHPEEVPDAGLPRAAIRPYPVEHVREERLGDGRRVRVRPVRPEDEQRVAAFHADLSDRTVRLRYSGPRALEDRISHDRLLRLCAADYTRNLTLVAESLDGGDPGPVVAVGRLMRSHGRPEAAFSLVVADAWQRHGLGGALLAQILRVAAAEGIRRVHAPVLAENGAMLDLCRRQGGTIVPGPDGGPVTAAFDTVGTS